MREEGSEELLHVLMIKLGDLESLRRREMSRRKWLTSLPDEETASHHLVIRPPYI